MENQMNYTLHHGNCLDIMPTTTAVTRPLTLRVWHWQMQSFVPAEPPKQTRPKWVKRKCRPGQVWKYETGGVACIISVTHMDYAPQCEVILCPSIEHLSRIPRHHDGSMRTLGIMERELVELLGEWAPQLSPPNAPDQRGA
jgi:hypothetical protein